MQIKLVLKHVTVLLIQLTYFQIGCSNGFEEGLEVEAILGTRDSQQGIFYLVKWKGRANPELIPALLTFIHVPSQVIHFYANR